MVALSGGVDSATAAAMLVERGERVVGITMRLYNAQGTTASIGGRCCGPRDLEDARRICEYLDIPFYVVDFEKEFQRDVMDYFRDAYLVGKTPNPCAKCNQHIKFTPLLRRARALGAQVLVTGHYARIHVGRHGYRLRRGVDVSKDQSYFLFAMPADALAAVQFPLGELHKGEVREKAAAYGLPVAKKAESQEICFVPDGDYAGFVAKDALRRGRQVPPPGDIVDEDGQFVGTHRGVHHYTVGQRRGLGKVDYNGNPAYVTRIDPVHNQLVVGGRDSIANKHFQVREVQWFGPRPDKSVQLEVQVRHRSPAMPASVQLMGSQALVTFSDVPSVTAPGQAAVFYERDTVIGGGWIA